jgi:hypothetical protein
LKRETWILKRKKTYANGLGETVITDIDEKEQFPIEEFDYLDWF